MKKTDEELLTEIQELYQKLGRTPKRREYISNYVASKRFGSWNAALKAAGLEVVTKRKDLTKAELIELVLKAKKELGRVPLSNPEHFPYYRQAMVKFGTWNKFLIEAGLQPNPNAEIKYTDDYLIEEVQQMAKRLGYLPHTREFPHYILASNRFGSWRNFLREAGLTPRNVGAEKYTNEFLIRAVQEQAEKLGRPPKTSEFKHYSILKARFKSWNEFLELAGLETYQEYKKQTEED
ncbi:homing endonuclease associated repeat-containing protein [Listeria booriae]|uniref:homing endonuclease associated repeat-containing protein n=1 Tax=Listeria booriae TaxID=1552123 RepID=UPI00164D74F4|nr:hypothetical protein [Listeria booriae]MBC6301523.1 hypothetical protein [Listeria booriae]